MQRMENKAKYPHSKFTDYESFLIFFSLSCKHMLEILMGVHAGETSKNIFYGFF